MEKRPRTERLTFQIELLASETTLCASFRPKPPLNSFYGHELKVSRLVHLLAADVLKRTDEVGGRWVVYADPSYNRVVVELVHKSSPAAERCLRNAVKDFKKEYA